jgi:hypothetical protein
MYENSLRAYTRQSFEKNTFESSQLYEVFDKVSSQKDYSWRSGEVPRDAREIGTVTKKNRVICSPCRSYVRQTTKPRQRMPLTLNKLDLLLMNAFNAVNLAAACLITSVEQAEKLGIPEEKWVYILGGAGTHEREHCK